MTIHVFTFASDEAKVKYLRDSEKLHTVNITYIIKNTWEGYITKIIETQKAIDTFPDNDIVAFIDAYDVIINGDHDELLEKFLNYNCDVLLSAELNCYPPFLKGEMDKIESGNIKNKYINSGGYMGYVKDIKKIFQWKSLMDITNICRNGSDQAYFIKYFIENHNNVNIKLDVNSNIFQCMHLISWKEIDFRNGRVFNNILKTYPVFVHFNGGTWQTNERTNIMPTFIEKIQTSINNPHNIYNLDNYNQIITSTCYPHSQL
jgi:hypothetical protein